MFRQRPPLCHTIVAGIRVLPPYSDRMLRWFRSAGSLVLACIFLLPPAFPGGSARAQDNLVRRQHRDWTVQCRPTHQGPPLCLAFTILKAPNGAQAGILGVQPVAGQRLVSLSMESGYSLGSRVELRVDGNPPASHNGCENLHCHILLSAEDPMQDQLRRGIQLYVQGDTMDYQASLLGYTAAQETWAQQMQSVRR